MCKNQNAFLNVVLLSRIINMKNVMCVSLNWNFIYTGLEFAYCIVYCIVYLFVYCTTVYCILYTVLYAAYCILYIRMIQKFSRYHIQTRTTWIMNLCPDQIQNHFDFHLYDPSKTCLFSWEFAYPLRKDKLCEIANGCLEYILSVVEVSSCS